MAKGKKTSGRDFPPGKNSRADDPDRRRLRGKGSSGPSPPPLSGPLLTLTEAAALLKLNRRTVREYVHRGELTGHVIGGRWRFRREDIARFVEETPTQWSFREKREHAD